jgi:CRISPR-associated exonuclease Cas4
MQDDFLFISALQHIAYCPRQFALIHVEQVWAENRFTAEGQLLHERVDSGAAEQRGSLRSERGVLLTSEKYQIKGKMDLLEIEARTGPEAGLPPRYFPVEYKRGKPKVQDWDRIQLCAQALCIEEMRNTKVEQGAIWYWEVRRREPILIDDRLRMVTVSMIEQARAILAAGTTPSPIKDRSRCKACSLLDLCQPNTFSNDHTKAYIAELFSL